MSIKTTNGDFNDVTTLHGFLHPLQQQLLVPQKRQICKVPSVREKKKAPGRGAWKVSYILNPKPRYSVIAARMRQMKAVPEHMGRP